MDYFAGLDVSVKETSVCIVDDTGKIVRKRPLSRMSVTPRRLTRTRLQQSRAYQFCRQTNAALTTKFHTVPISAPARPAIHHLLS